MYYFNFLLFKKLNSLIGTTQKELSMKVFEAEYRYRQKVENQNRILVSDLVHICNTLHISISHFISLNPDSYYIDNSIKYIIDKQLFKPITFENRNINKMYGKNGLAGNLTQIEFANKFKVASTSVYLWANQEKCSMKLYQLLDLCNTFGINIGEFIEDENIPLPMNDVVIGKGGKSANKQFEELIEMREINSHNQREIAALKRSNKSMELSFKGNCIAAEEQQPYSSNKAVIRNWVFNKDLLNNIPSLLQISQRNLMTNLGMANPAVSYSDGNITVRLLVDICNKYQISTKHFFFRENENANVIRELSFYQSDDFKQIVFHPEYIFDIFGVNSITEMSLDEVLNLIGYSETKIKNWRNLEKSTLRVTELIEICNALSVTPSCFITDTNKTMVIYSTTQAEHFLEENRLLRQEIIRLNESIKRLKKKSTNKKK